MKIITMMYLEAHREYFPLYRCLFSFLYGYLGIFGFFGPADSDSGQYTRCAILLYEYNLF